MSRERERERERNNYIYTYIERGESVRDKYENREKDLVKRRELYKNNATKFLELKKYSVNLEKKNLMHYTEFNMKNIDKKIQFKQL